MAALHRNIKRRLSDATSEATSLVQDGAVKMRHLLQWTEILEWQQEDNNYIETGYRPASGSYRESLRSWGYVHNETVNIFSHLLGCLLFLGLPYGLYRELQPRYSNATHTDVVVFAAYLFGVAVCFALSVTYHTFANHSAKIAAIGMQLDFQGILLLMWGATMPTIYYGLYCEAELRKVYWLLVSTLVVACSVITFTPTFRSPFVRPLRVAVFGGFALSTLVPIIHSVILHGWDAQNYRVSLDYLLGVLAFNMTGAAAYAAKFPEKYYRRKFDIVGGSHQIMHVMVLCAAIVHLFGLLRNFDHLHRNPQPGLRNAYFPPRSSDIDGQWSAAPCGLQIAPRHWHQGDQGQEQSR